jgi:nicotinate-nucleotide adenylyltransferase
MVRPAPNLLEPFRWKGLRIGLLGGSFNPPHAGHVHATLVAMKYLQLDAVWWLVSPGNPLKSKDGLLPLTSRVTQCKGLTSHPDIIVTDIEKDLGTTRTFDTVTALQTQFSSTEFVWLSGTDIAYEFSRWYRWRDLMKLIPFAFIGRPTTAGLVRHNVFRQVSGLHQHTPQHGSKAELTAGHIYWLFGEPLNPLSSTMLREQSRDL